MDAPTIIAVVIMVALFVQYVSIIGTFLLGKFETKISFLVSLIPFSFIIFIFWGCAIQWRKLK